MRRCRRGVGCKPGGVGLRGLIDQDDGCGSRRVAGELLVGDEDARTGVLDDVGDFVGRQPEVYGEKDCADVARREGDIEKRRAVLHQYRDHVVRADPARGQPSADRPESVRRRWRS